MTVQINWEQRLDLSFSVFYAGSDGRSRIWLVVRDGLADITDTVWIDNNGNSASVTLEPIDGTVTPNITDIYEYTPADDQVNLILKNVRVFEHPSTFVVYREDFFSLANNGIEGFGYNGQEVQSIPNQRPFTEADNPSGWDWTGWVMQVGDGPITFFNGRLYVTCHSYLYAPGPGTYYKYVGLFRYNDTGSWENGSWSLVYSWGPHISASGTSGHIRLTSHERTSSNAAHMNLINSNLNSGRGEVTYSSGANRWLVPTSTPDQAINFNVLNTQQRPYQTMQHRGYQLSYAGRDADGDWLWFFNPNGGTVGAWERVYELFLNMYPAPVQGNSMWRKSGGASYEYAGIDPTSWTDTLRSIIPAWVEGIYVGIGYLTSGSNLQTYTFERSNGQWDLINFTTVSISGGGGQNNGVISIFNLREAQGWIMIYDASQHASGPTQADIVYTGTITSTIETSLFPLSLESGLYIGLFDPGGGDELLELARVDFWSGVELAQHVFQISLTDERVYLGRPYYVPAGAWVGRYVGDYIGEEGILSDSEDITDNLTTTEGVLGLDLTDGI